MAIAGSEGHGIAHPAHQHGRWPRRRGGSITDLPTVVLAPAAHGAVDAPRTRVGFTRCQRDRIAQAGNGHGSELVDLRPVAELPVGVVAPAHRTAERAYRAAVVGTGDHASAADAAAAAEHHARRRAIERRAVAELAERVVA